MKRLLTAISLTAALLAVALPAQADGFDVATDCTPAGTVTWVDTSTNPDQLVTTTVVDCGDQGPTGLIGIHEERQDLPIVTPPPSAPVVASAHHKRHHHHRHHHHR